MQPSSPRQQDWARLALAGIRLTVGCMALFTPRMFARRLDVDPSSQPAVIYVSRMFGVRTILIALDLLTGDEVSRARALRVGVFIHVSDALAAGIAALRHQLPRGAALKGMLLSSINAGLALAAQGRLPGQSS